MRKIMLCTALTLLLTGCVPAQAGEDIPAGGEGDYTVKTEYVENQVFTAKKDKAKKKADKQKKKEEEDKKEKKKDKEKKDKKNKEEKKEKSESKTDKREERSEERTEDKTDEKKQSSASVETPDLFELKREWLSDQDFVLEDPAPLNLEELKEAVDVKDPRSVAAYYVWSVNCLTKNYDDGMDMMKYLFADIEPFGRGYTEGGISGKAGWDSYFNERLKDSQYSWLPQAYFEGGERSNKFEPSTPLTIELYYNSTNTETINDQTLDSLGRLNIVYWVQSHAGGNQVNITLSRFEGTDRWYVTSGSSSSALFYQQ